MWHPILPLKESVHEHLQEINRQVLLHGAGMQQGGLLNGKMGYVMFLSYLKKHEVINTYDGQIESGLVDIFSMDDDTLQASFCRGLSGVLWGVQHLQRQQLIHLDESFEEYNVLLSKNISAALNNHDLDFLHGPIGNMLYLLDADPEKFEHLEGPFLNKLLSLAEDDQGILKWKTHILYSGGEVLPGYNLSLSHGMSGIILLLCKILEKGSAHEKTCRHLLQGGCAYLLSVKNKPNEISVFPASVFPGKEITPRSRLAWCYGDLCVGWALYNAGKCLDDQRFLSAGLNTLKATTARKTYWETEVSDAGFCHGTSGLAHFYNRIYQDTLLLVFKEASLYWIDQTLAFSKEEIKTCAGYGFYNHASKQQEENYNLLEGLTGIGLMLMAATSTVEPKWDRALLLS